MANLNLSLTFENVLRISKTLLDIFIMWLVLYYVIKIVRNNSRTSQIFKGIVVVVLVDIIAKFVGLKSVAWLADIFVNWGFLAIIIIFQPEIRTLLEKLGKTNVFSRLTTLSGNEKERLVDQIVTATMILSKNQIGALISIEQAHSLMDFIKTGTPINSIVTTELLASIFVTSTPLHDGAVIIQGDRIACASAYFPPTNLELSSKYGARHRAAIGISEITDAVTIVVSEETGTVSITDSGKIISVDKKQLRNYLLRVICGEETEVHIKKIDNEPMFKNYSNENGDEYIIDKKQEAKSEKRFDTAVLSKLAIKQQEKLLDKQEQEEKSNKKGIMSKIFGGSSNKVEEETNKIDDIDSTIESKTDPVEEAEEVITESMAELEESVEIKLPKKKQTFIQSYPISDGSVRVMGIDESKIVKKEVKEEVQEIVEEETNSERSKFDTTKIDISKIMGYDGELEDTFAMVDGFEHSKKKTVAAFSEIEEITPPRDSKGGVQ